MTNLEQSVEFMRENNKRIECAIEHTVKVLNDFLVKKPTKPKENK